LHKLQERSEAADEAAPKVESPPAVAAAPLSHSSAPATDRALSNAGPCSLELSNISLFGLTNSGMPPLSIPSSVLTSFGVEFLGKQDPYVQLLRNKVVVLTTPVHQDGGSKVSWAVSVRVPNEQSSLASSPLKIRVYDKNTLLGDNLLGKATVDSCPALSRPGEWVDLSGDILHGAGKPSGQYVLKARYDSDSNLDKMSAPVPQLKSTEFEPEAILVEKVESFRVSDDSKSTPAEVNRQSHETKPVKVDIAPSQSPKNKSPRVEVKAQSHETKDEIIDIAPSQSRNISSDPDSGSKRTDEKKKKAKKDSDDDV
jgi:hypothetical protein